MNPDKKKIMTGYLEKALSMRFEKILYAFPQPGPTSPTKTNSNFVEINLPRLFIPLSGVKHLCASLEHQVKEFDIRPGELLFCSNGAWSQEIWNSAHEMIVIVFFGDITRVIYAKHDGVKPPPPGPDVFYHFHRPLEIPTVQTLNALDALAQNNNGIKDNQTGIYLCQAILQMILNQFRMTESIKTKRQLTFTNLNDFIMLNYAVPIGRKDAADTLKIHPSHISRLIKQYTCLSFSQYLTKIRMIRAAHLLEVKSLSVDEVAAMTGFNYTSYFIRCFSKYYGMSPTAYRSKL